MAEQFIESKQKESPEQIEREIESHLRAVDDLLELCGKEQADVLNKKKVQTINID